MKVKSSHSVWAVGRVRAAAEAAACFPWSLSSNSKTTSMPPTGPGRTNRLKLWHGTGSRSRSLSFEYSLNRSELNENRPKKNRALS